MLDAAFAAGDDFQARAIVARIRARNPSADVLDALSRYERVLDGRALVHQVALQLECNVDASGELCVRLLGSCARDETVVLRLPPGKLRALWTAVDPFGDERRMASTHAVEGLQEVALGAGVTFETVLLRERLPTDGFLALRGRFDLELHAGEALSEDESLPAYDIAVAPCETVALASFLPTDPVEPQELVRYVSTPGFALPAAMERAVRIPNDRRQQALELLAPRIQAMNAIDLERLAPTLRWLAGSARQGGDPAAWRQYFRDRAARTQERDDLELPDRMPLRD
jgi:hypothetical protein